MEKSLSIFFKKIRLSHGDERLSDMAKKLGVSASYLSTVENGKKPMNDRFLNKVIETYQLSQKEANELRVLKNLNSDTINVSLEDMDEEKRLMVIKFLSNIDSISDKDIEKINLMVKKDK